MKTKIGKALTVFLVFCSVAFMALATASSLTRTDWKERTKDYPGKIEAQKKELETLDQETARWDARLKDAKLANAKDIEAMSKREVVLAAELKKLEDAASALSVQSVTKAKEAQAKRDEARLRREEAIALRNQLDELRAQRVEALAVQRRLSDLLVQALGTKERVERRKELLQADGADATKAYEELVPPPKKQAEPQKKPQE